MCEKGQSYEINRRAVLASVTVGNGSAASQSMCADLNMPNPMAQHTFQEHLASIKSAGEVAAKQSIVIAAMELRNAMGVHGDEQRWQRCTKTVFSGRDHLDYALADAALHFNCGNMGHGELFSLLGLDIGQHSAKFYEISDTRRIAASTRKNSQKEKKN